MLVSIVTGIAFKDSPIPESSSIFIIFDQKTIISLDPSPIRQSLLVPYNLAIIAAPLFSYCHNSNYQSGTNAIEVKRHFSDSNHIDRLHSPLPPNISYEFIYTASNFQVFKLSQYQQTS